MVRSDNNKKKVLSGIDIFRISALIFFALMVFLLAWQSDDAYHGYVMARNLAEGHGFVYNIGERSTASTGPLFTLLIALAYFVTREMFFTSMAVCTVLSAAAFYILIYKFCHSIEQIIIVLLAFFGSISFISYTTSGLENSLLFFLGALFLLMLSKYEHYNFRTLVLLALIISAIAMARMDAVLIFAPAAVWIYLAKRKDTSFPKAVVAGIIGLLPFVLWEAFSCFYFGFPFPNPAYVKLGTGISELEYIKRGIFYIIYTGLNDVGVILITLISVILCIFVKSSRYIALSIGILLYLAYIIWIGGDFMMGRHFTVIFFIAVSMFVIVQNKEISNAELQRRYKTIFNISVLVCLICTLGFSKVIGSQYLMGHKYSSHISDEREYYYSTTGLYNNLISLISTGRLCVSDTWNNEAPDDLKMNGLQGGIIDNAAGILVYYNPDLYLGDTYCLGDPFLSKLPAIYDPNWRVGHLRREVPEGYRESIWHNDNEIADPSLHEYYDVIRLITRGKLLDKNRIRAVVDINLGKYDHLIEEYERRVEKK